MDKSDIRGTGYGSKHLWKNLGTKQLPYLALIEDKCTTYQCSKCGIIFQHYYGVEPLIFFAMEDANIKNKCE